ncbi:MAG: sugar transporter [Bryobacterales bacterium]|nr:sugar transporter [Bryobacterales bacterium]
MSEPGVVSMKQLRRSTAGRYALFNATAVSSLGGFLFGYDNIVISGAIEHLSKYFQLEPASIGWAAGCALIGCLLGSATAGAIADRFGLKRALYVCAACFALSSIGVWSAASFSQYVAWRIVGGVGIGAASIVAPMYIAEIAPAKVRGRLVVLYQFGIVAGILCAVYVNMLIERSGIESWQIAHGWRWMFAAAAIPAIVFALAILFSEESPRWLMKVGRQEEAQHVLALVSGESAARSEAASIKRSLAEEKGGLQELFEGPFRRALLIGFLLAAFSQTSGITALLSFLPEVFKSAGQKASDAFFQSVLVGIVNLAFTVLAIWLVDRTGRKTLILLGTCLQALSLAVVAFLYMVPSAGSGILGGIMAFVAGHAIGNGAVCWVIISEIFPTKVRGLAMSIATTAIWIFAYLADQFFPIMQKHLGSHGAFLVFSCMAALNFLFVLLYVPETKGYSLEEISRIWLPHSAADSHSVNTSNQPSGSLL